VVPVVLIIFLLFWPKKTEKEIEECVPLVDRASDLEWKEASGERPGDGSEEQFTNLPFCSQFFSMPSLCLNCFMIVNFYWMSQYFSTMESRMYAFNTKVTIVLTLRLYLVKDKESVDYYVEIFGITLSLLFVGSPIISTYLYLIWFELS
jgi:hypothetical protein